MQDTADTSPVGDMALVGVLSEPDDGATETPTEPTTIPNDGATTPNEEPDTVIDEDEEIDPTTPEGAIRYAAETNRLVWEARCKVREAESSFECAKETANDRKKRLELLEDELGKLIDEREAGKDKKPQKNLFSDIDKKGGDGKIDKPVATSVDLPIGSADPLGNLWEQFPIDLEGPWLSFGLKKGDIEKLNAGDVKDGPAHPILTMGDMSRYTSPNPASPSFTRRLIDIQGVGKAAAERIESALVEFWAWWNRKGQAEFATAKGITNATQPADASEVRGDGVETPDGDQVPEPAAVEAAEPPAETAPTTAEEPAAEPAEVPKPKRRGRRSKV